MQLIEWFFLVWSVLSVLGSLYYIAQGGLDMSPGERIFQFALCLGILIWLIMAGPLTWFGVALIVLYIYNLVVIPWIVLRNPDGNVMGTAALSVDLIIGLVCILLVLTVGITV